MKKIFLGEESDTVPMEEQPLSSALVVGSTVRSFFSGMDISRRIALNLVIITIGVSYAISLLTQRLRSITI